MKIGSFNLDTDGAFIIAELSANHGGSINIAKESIKAAFEAGANAIKLQTYTADSLTLDSDNEDFIIKGGTLWDDKKLYELYEEAALPLEWHTELFTYAREIGIDIFSSPFDLTAVDFLEQFSPSAYKIASFEITDYELVRYVASKGKPVIISTGIATLEEIQDVISICREEKNEDIILLKCTSSYPAPIKEANLISIPEIAKTFNVISGFSDHTLGTTAPVVAVTLGAKVIEKHFILDKSFKSADATFSLDKKEFTEMVNAVRQAQQLLGSVDDFKLTKKRENARQFSRSLYVSKAIQKGELFSKENIKSVRPGYGLHPKHLQEVLGKTAKKDFLFAEKLTKDVLE